MISLGVMGESNRHCLALGLVLLVEAAISEMGVRTPQTWPLSGAKSITAKMSCQLQIYMPKRSVC